AFQIALRLRASARSCAPHAVGTRPAIPPFKSHPPRATIAASLLQAESFWAIANMAERVGFEPTVPLPAHVLSRHADSAALAPLHAFPFQRGGILARSL